MCIPMNSSSRSFFLPFSTIYPLHLQATMVLLSVTTEFFILFGIHSVFYQVFSHYLLEILESCSYNSFSLHITIPQIKNCQIQSCQLVWKPGTMKAYSITGERYIFNFQIPCMSYRAQGLVQGFYIYAFLLMTKFLSSSPTPFKITVLFSFCLQRNLTSHLNVEHNSIERCVYITYNTIKHDEVFLKSFANEWLQYSQGALFSLKLKATVSIY